VDPADALAAFDAQFGSRTPTREELQAFVNEYFLTAGSDTVLWVPDDYQNSPPTLQGISNVTLRNWAFGLNDLWLALGRQQISSVKDYPQRYTLVWQPFPLVVPGGRFLESYYWGEL
jgi:alpha,alpha-trehalase